MGHVQTTHKHVPRVPLMLCFPFFFNSSSVWIMAIIRALLRRVNGAAVQGVYVHRVLMNVVPNILWDRHRLKDDRCGGTPRVDAACVDPRRHLRIVWAFPFLKLVIAVLILLYDPTLVVDAVGRRFCYQGLIRHIIRVTKVSIQGTDGLTHLLRLTVVVVEAQGLLLASRRLIFWLWLQTLRAVLRPFLSW